MTSAKARLDDPHHQLSGATHDLRPAMSGERRVIVEDHSVERDAARHASRRCRRDIVQPLPITLRIGRPLWPGAVRNSDAPNRIVARQAMPGESAPGRSAPAPDRRPDIAALSRWSRGVCFG